MPHDQPWPMTLAVAGCHLDLHVAGFAGQEALNEVWHVEIDLVGRDPHLDIGRLPGRPACLRPTPAHPGMQGEITQARQLHAGTCLSHYRVSLKPRLQRLSGQTRLRLLHGLSTPQIITQILDEHGFSAEDFRFEQLHGHYPPRPQCMQHHESDLHLVLRLCEEEGIHFRFEGRQLVFSDDSASFPEQPVALVFGDQPQSGVRVSRVTEHLALQPLVAHQPYSVQAGPLPCAQPASAHTQADNQPFSAPRHSASAWHAQRRARSLERLRGQARRLSACSTESSLCCGQVIRLSGHPEPRYNDHWLLTRVQHSGRQTGVFEGHDPYDIAAIVGKLAGPPAADDRDGYRNHFEVMPWTQPYRPPLRHRKPSMSGLQAATLMGTVADRHGCLPVRLDWQTETETSMRTHWPRALLIPGRLADSDRLQAGSRVMLACLNNDPERLAICAVLPGPRPAHEPQLSIDGTPLDPTVDSVAVLAGQHLHITAERPLSLRGAAAGLILDRTTIRLNARQALHLQQCPAQPPLSDLRLAPDGIALGNTTWYIVRMATPGLEYLSQLDPEDVLFEGRTDEHGYLGLSAAQLRLLAREYANTPRQLCLIHPGRCVTLHQHLRQSGNDGLHRALLAAARNHTPNVP